MGKPEIIGWRDAEGASYAPINIEINDHCGRPELIDRRTGRVVPLDNRLMVTTLLRRNGLRPIYRERPFKARVRADGGYLLECRTCGTQEECNPSTLLHDRAVLHDRELHSGGPRRVPPMGVVV